MIKIILIILMYLNTSVFATDKCNSNLLNTAIKDFELKEEIIADIKNGVAQYDLITKARLDNDVDEVSRIFKYVDHFKQKHYYEAAIELKIKDSSIYVENPNFVHSKTPFHLISSNRVKLIHKNAVTVTDIEKALSLAILEPALLNLKQKNSSLKKFQIIVDTKRKYQLNLQNTHKKIKKVRKKNKKKVKKMKANKRNVQGKNGFNTSFINLYETVKSTFLNEFLQITYVRQQHSDSDTKNFIISAQRVARARYLDFANRQTNATSSQEHE